MNIWSPKFLLNRVKDIGNIDQHILNIPQNPTGITPLWIHVAGRYFIILICVTIATNNMSTLQELLPAINTANSCSQPGSYEYYIGNQLIKYLRHILARNSISETIARKLTRKVKTNRRHNIKS